MESKYQYFNIGDFRCTLFTDGKHAYDNPGALLFPNAPENELGKALIQYGISIDKWPTWVSDYTCLLIDTGKNKILVETGAGEMLPEAGKLVCNMQAAGISPASIDIVLVTHAHPDHIGGATLFPNARILMNRKEWQFWTGKPKLPRLSDDFQKLLTGMVTTLLKPLRKRVELIDGDTEIVPGISLVETPGHTPGHMALLATSGGEHLVYVGDALIHEIHVETPSWSPIVDVMPEKSVQTRIRLLTEAAETGAIFFGFHMPKLGRITSNTTGFKLLPYSSEVVEKKWTST
ncbi:MBL fold metallo-hydrolase [Desulfogranum mediterraneum]|uniref:MBL fold metallo-hydrolase n=1 Tax=Desulfogranum mediterraneum TaxID=160661 RepID=UPI0004910597|nr:MBL fold metallo-hydrolase [Desulfogranum mediterraneum]